MPHAPATRRAPELGSARLGDSDLESGEIPDSDPESDDGFDLSSLTVASLGQASFGSLASRMAAKASGPVGAKSNGLLRRDKSCGSEDAVSCKRCTCFYYVVELVVVCESVFNSMVLLADDCCTEFDAADPGAAFSSAEKVGVE